VAIGAAHLALVDLGLDRPPSVPVSYQRADVFDFGSPHVVELEHRRIGFPAVNARVAAQVIGDALTIGRYESPIPFEVRVLVLLVVRMGAGPGTRSAPPMAGTSLS
jgi:hypothetical protein